MGIGNHLDRDLSPVDGAASPTGFPEKNIKLAPSLDRQKNTQSDECDRHEGKSEFELLCNLVVGDPFQCCRCAQSEPKPIPKIPTPNAAAAAVMVARRSAPDSLGRSGISTMGGSFLGTVGLRSGMTSVFRRAIIFFHALLTNYRAIRNIST
jgi:hypothetical protein